MNEFQLNIFNRINNLFTMRTNELEKNSTTFVLNPVMTSINREIFKLQEECKHELVEEGKCKICKKTIGGI